VVRPLSARPNGSGMVTGLCGARKGQRCGSPASPPVSWMEAAERVTLALLLIRSPRVTTWRSSSARRQGKLLGDICLWRGRHWPAPRKGQLAALGRLPGACRRARGTCPAAWCRAATPPAGNATGADIAADVPARRLLHPAAAFCRSYRRSNGRVPLVRYRWRVKQIGRRDRVGSWQPTREAARLAAFRAGFGTWSKEHGWSLDVLTTIEDDPQSDPSSMPARRSI
jgi:hypothetical protein